MGVGTWVHMRCAIELADLQYQILPNLTTATKLFCSSGLLVSYLPQKTWENIGRICTGQSFLSALRRCLGLLHFSLGYHLFTLEYALQQFVAGRVWHRYPVGLESQILTNPSKPMTHTPLPESKHISLDSLSKVLAEDSHQTPTRLYNLKSFIIKGLVGVQWESSINHTTQQIKVRARLELGQVSWVFLG